jgi:8-oxo-dGTP pyrophosphatase MutT (NUDIX family)
VSPDAPWPEVRARIQQRLAPPDAWDPAGGTTASDYDLNPSYRPPEARTRRPAAVLVPIVEHDDGPTILLTRRADALARHAGQVAFPGGRADDGEAPWETALREAHEEVGLEPERVTVAGLARPYETATGFVVTPVVGFVRPGFTPKPDPAEVAEVFEAPFAFLMDSSSYEERSQVFAGAERFYYAVSHGDQLIWGATAGMLRGLREQLFGEAA